MSNHTTAAIANQGEAKPTTAGTKKKPKVKSTIGNAGRNPEDTAPADNPATSVGSEKAKACSTSSLSPKEVQNRLQQAARILANGAIRAALKQRKASQAPAPEVLKPDADEASKARPPRTALPKRKKVTIPPTQIAAAVPL